MIVAVLLLLSCLANIVLGFVVFRFAKKLMAFDKLFELMVDEINININYFKKLLSTPLFMASQEIEEAHQNMNLMMVRLEEFVSQISELAGKDLSTPTLPAPVTSSRPPVVVD